MNYKVKTTPSFDREIKRIAKKYKGIKADLLKLIEDLEQDPIFYFSECNITTCFNVQIAKRGTCQQLPSRNH